MSTISNTITHGITLGSAGYTSPLTITTSGYVENTGTGNAIYGPSTQVWSVVNYGRLINSGTSGQDGIDLRNGGFVANSGTIICSEIGVFIGAVTSSFGDYTGVPTGTVTNYGTISATGLSTIGVWLDGGGTVTNTAGGLIIGGVQIEHQSGVFTNFGTIEGGVGLLNGTATNDGLIVGGIGVFGGTVAGAGVLINAGTVQGTGTMNPAAAVDLTNDVTLVNSGFIDGYIGVRVTYNGTIVDSGTIVGTAGRAIEFGDTGAWPPGPQGNWLVLEPGYRIVGEVLGSVATTNTLELTGTAGNALVVNYNGLRLGNFNDVLFGSGGNATLEVTNTSGTLPLTISGFTQTSDVIDLTAIGTNGAITSQDMDEVTLAGSLGSMTLLFAGSGETAFTTTSDGATGTLLEPACFCRGTMILTTVGEVAVEDLTIGDEVVTVAGEARPVRWIGRRAYDGRFIAGNRNILPITISESALEDGAPRRDLVISPGHSLHIDGALVLAEHLVNGATIVQAHQVDAVEYFHIELDSHDIIFAEGVPTESYADCDNRLQFENAADYARLYPDDERPRWAFCQPPLNWRDPALTEIRAALLRRAEASGHTLTLDPDLRLIADGATLRPERIDGGAYRFVLPSGSNDVWLSSRNVVPAAVDANSHDLRRLGVPVERIVLAEGDLVIEARHGHTGFAVGFHDDEPSHRWTDGMARLPLPLLQSFTGSIRLEVHLIPSALGYRVASDAESAAAAGSRVASIGNAALNYTGFVRSHLLGQSLLCRHL